ncbi:hypothetical protein JZ785_25145 [Alicyclobacillus curvatus]|nr:hypothetical protein JZ785_25145 [Alicyclobacillus curvatus]
MIGYRFVFGLATVAGLGALALGLIVWIFGGNLIMLHMIFGFTLVLILLGLSLVAVFTKGMRGLGTLGILDAIIVAVVGRTQTVILTGHLHWLIQAIHLILGVLAVHLSGTMGLRLLRQKKKYAETGSISPGGEL